MTSKKMLAVLSPVISLAVLLAGGCAQAVEAQNTPAITISNTATVRTVDSASLTTTQTTATPSMPPSQTPAAQPADTAYSTDPAPWELTSDPILADFTPAQLRAEYKADPAAADAKYWGKTFLFKNVVIDEMAMLYKGQSSPADAWVINGMVYFKTDNKSRIMNLKVGDIIDVTGVVVGPMQNYVLVDHCAYKLIDETNGITRPNWIDIPG